MRPIVAGSTTVLLLLLANCAAPEPTAPIANPPSPDSNVARVKPVSIIGSWRVESIEGALGAVKPPATGGAVTIEFSVADPAEGGRVSGMAGVNRFAGRYDFSPGEAEVGALSISGVGRTQMAGPADRQSFEETFLAALAQARTVTRETSGLVIDCGEARVRLRPMGG